MDMEGWVEALADAMRASLQGREEEGVGTAAELTEDLFRDEEALQRLPELYEEALRRVGEGISEGPQEPGELEIARKPSLPLRAAFEALSSAYRRRLNELRTVQERGEASARHAEERYRRLVDNLRQGLFVYSHDTDGVFTYVSPSVTDVLGYTRHEFLTHYQEYETESPINRDTQRHTQLSIRGVQQPPYEVEIYHRDGTTRRLEIREVPIFDDDGEVVEVEGIALDVTEQRRIEEKLRQFQRVEAVGQLAGGLAHEYNNMLTGIIGLAELSLDDVEEGSSLHKDLQGIREIALRAAGLTRQLLAYSRRQNLEYTEVDLNDVISHGVKMIRRVIGGKVELAVRPAPDLVQVMADPLQIEQVLVNLAINARDSMPEGGQLTISTETLIVDDTEAANFTELAPGRYAQVVVADTGEGIPPEIQERILEPFFTTKAMAEASGLGLSTSYGIVKQHSGHMSFSSEPGEGTRMRFILPAAEREPTVDAPTRPPAVAPAGESTTILVVEDEPSVLTVVRRTLEARGYQVLPAQSPGAAKEIFAEQAEEIDLLLTDVVMAGQTGPQLHRELVTTRPDLKVLFMSGYAKRTPEEGGILDREAPFLSKPFAVDELVRLVRETLAG